MLLIWSFLCSIRVKSSLWPCNSIYHVLDDSENTISYNRDAKQSVCMRKTLPLHPQTAGSHICHIPTAKTNLNIKIPLNFKNKKNGLQLYIVNRHTWRSVGMFYFTASVNPWSLKILFHHVVHCWLVSYRCTVRKIIYKISTDFAVSDST